MRSLSSVADYSQADNRLSDVQLLTPLRSDRLRQRSELVLAMEESQSVVVHEDPIV